MKRFKVVVTDYVFPTLDPERTILGEAGAELIAAQCKSPEEVIALARGADAMLNTYYKPVDGAVMDAMPGCRIIVRYGIGVDSIDLAAATQRNIAVANVPDYCIDEVSDHALAMALALLRKLAFSDRRLREGAWQLGPLKPLRRIRTLTFGIIGMGRIGRAIAAKAAAFGPAIVFHDPYFKGPLPVPGARAVSLDELYALADAVIVQAPATPQTHHLLADDAFARMQRCPVIVNCARGELIDTAALIRALDAGRVSGAGLDVIEGMPPLPADSPLRRFDNVLLTPHSAWLSETALEDLQRLAALEVARALRGERPQALLNPEVWDRVTWRKTT
jgi:D-3-phosphoglycerate dehydrogenase / 2-oxoglutarate reductase